LDHSRNLKKHQGRRISNRKLRRLLLRTDIVDAFNLNISQVEDKLDESYQEYKKAHADASSWRDEFLVGLAKSRSESKGTDQDKELQQLRTIEQQRTVARNIKRMQGKLQRNATTQVCISNEQGRRTVTSKEDIEDACIEENISRFSQSNNTPLMQEPLLSLIGYLANTQAAEDILQGTFETPPETDKYTKLLIAELRMPDNIRTNPMTQNDVTPEDNRRAWSKQRETISSEPEGLSFSLQSRRSAPQNKCIRCTTTRHPIQIRILPTSLAGNHRRRNTQKSRRL
jgi:hypothetical protein